MMRNTYALQAGFNRMFRDHETYERPRASREVSTPDLWQPPQRPERDQQYEATLDEVGDEIGVGRERARQIEAKALRKIRLSPAAPRLKKLWEET